VDRNQIINKNKKLTPFGRKPGLFQDINLLKKSIKSVLKKWEKNAD